MFSLITIMGTMAAIGGSVGYFTFSTGLAMGIKMMINLAQDGMVYPIYMNPPVGPKSTFYFYSIKNPQQVLQGKKATFKLKGPYVFDTVLMRKNIKFSDEGEKVSFDSSRELAWDLANSANISEKFWVINPILPSTAVLVKSLVLDRIPFKRLVEPIVFNTVNLLLDNFNERLMMRTTPKQLLDGREVQLLAAVVGLAERFGVASLLPPVPPQSVFGLVYVQNRTIDNTEIWTGVGRTRDKYAEVSKYKGKDRLQVWRGGCNTISGTNGELYKPFLERGKSVRVFLAPLCRSFYMDPVGDGLVTTRSGVGALEYEISGRLFQGARSYPDNKCYCTDVRTYDCQYDGLVFMGPCYFDSPIYFTRPNFKGADPKISELVDWRSALATTTTTAANSSSRPQLSVSDKQSFMVERITGAVLGVDMSLMATFKVVRHPYMRDLANVQNLTYMPLFVTNEKLQLPFSNVWQLYYLQKFDDYHKPLMAGTALSGVAVLVLKFLFG